MGKMNSIGLCCVYGTKGNYIFSVQHCVSRRALFKQNGEYNKINVN